MRNLILVTYARNDFLKVQVYIFIVNHLLTLQKNKTNNLEPSSNKSSFVDCGETMKIEDIKEEINEEESVEDPLSIHQETRTINICDDIKEEVKEEESVYDPLSI